MPKYDALALVSLQVWTLYLAYSQSGQRPQVLALDGDPEWVVVYQAVGVYHGQVGADAG